MSEANDPFKRFSSYIDKIVIPLQNFSYFHKPSEPGQIDPSYIEKKKNYYILKNWITNNRAKGGVLPDHWLPGCR